MSLGSQMLKGLAWSGIGRISVQVVQFIIGIILARILTPKEYGIIGILLVFITISNVFIDSGFTKALIQKQQRTIRDISTVFWFNIFISIICYLLLWITAPYIANFYDLGELSLLLRILSFSLIINALYTVPTTLFTIDLDFKTISKINLIATILSGIVAIYFAHIGYGVWALVIQIIVRSILTALLTWLMAKWKPSFIFSKESLKELFSYGSKLLASSLLNTTVNNFYSLFIAKLISTRDLGFYTRGSQFSDVVFGVLSSALDSVLLPGLSTIQEQREVLISYTRTIIKSTALFSVPIFLFLAVLAEPIIRVLLTEKWMEAVPIMQIFCIARLITVISGININLLYVIGRTDLALRQNYFKIIIRIIAFIIALDYGIYYIALAELISTVIHFFINTYYPGKIMDYGALQQLKDMSKIISISLLVVLVSYIFMQILNNDMLKLFIIPITMIFLYVGLIYLFRIPEYFVLLKKIKYSSNKN